MEKDVILKMAQKEQNEEFEHRIYHEAMTKGAQILVILCIGIFLFKVIMSDVRGLEKVIPFYDVVVILTGYTAAVYFGMYRRIKDKKYLLVSAVNVCFFIAFIMKLITTI